MRKKYAQKILNYEKYKLVFFGDKQQLLREFKLCKLRLTSVRIFIKPYSLELKVIYQLVSTKTNRLLVLVFRVKESTQLIENSANFAVPVIRSVEMFKLITRNVHE